jgi:prophage tail gpP-like protein
MSFNPQQIAAINVGGVSMTQWVRVDVEREWGTTWSFANFEAVEAAAMRQPIMMPQAMPEAAPATVTLGGQLAISGKVYRRAVDYTKDSHNVQIGIWSGTRLATDQSVKAAPGEYVNQTLTQVTNAVLAPIGLKAVVAAGPGASLPFPVVRETPGETVIEFVERLARHRGMHISDDQSGNTLHFNPLTLPSGGGADFVEGGNIIRGRILIQSEYATAKVETKSQPPATSKTNTASIPNAEAVATGQGAANVGVTNPTPYRLIVAELPSNQQELALRLGHQVVLDQMKTCMVTVTVDGWFDPNGQLWLNKIGNEMTKATLKSPMLVPTDVGQPTWFVKRVRSYQSNQEGTMTDITICTVVGMSSQPQVGP